MADSAGDASGGTNRQIAIVGAGFSGIAMGIALKRAGIDSFTIYEKASDLGGTWRQNTYDGLACDVPSHLYCYSFEPNPNWSRAYAPQREILEYIRHCAKKYGVYGHIRFDTEITSAQLDEATGLWTLTSSTSLPFAAGLVVWAQGPLNKPIRPDIPGMESFAGEMTHSAEWRQDYDFTGKRVAVVGAGASAIGVVPAVARKASQLYVFQRAPTWVMPKFDRAFSAKEIDRFRRYPFLIKLIRGLIYWFIEVYGPTLIYKSWLNKIPEAVGKLHIRKHIKDPELRRKLTPTHRVGCKRTLYSDDYYPAFARENVRLLTEEVAALTPSGVVSRDGERLEVDAIVWCTGFDTSFSTSITPIHGRGGRLLSQSWVEGDVPYKGVATHGFPNLFVLVGPNTGPGHTSVLVYLEAQVSYVMQIVQAWRRQDLASVEVREDVQDHYNASIQRRMKNTTWLSGCTSWYLANHGRNLTLFPGLNFEYRLRLRRFTQAEYQTTTRVAALHERGAGDRSDGVLTQVSQQ